MMMWKRLLSGCVALVWVLSAWAEVVPPKKIGPAWVWTVKGDYEEVREDLVEAIEGRGLVISYVSHAQSMLSRTAQVVGATEPVYRHAEILLFCKADLSHRLVAANPHNIVLCPYAIAVYDLAGDGQDEVFLSIRTPQGAPAAYRPVVDLLTAIISEVVEG